MTDHDEEARRREEAALEAISEALEDDDYADSVQLFVRHHLEELEASYWKRHLGTEKPEPSAVLELLERRESFSDSDEEEDEGYRDRSRDVDDEDDDDDESDDLGDDEDEDEESLDILEFTLPDDVTQYLLVVSFDEDGEVESIAMES